MSDFFGRPNLVLHSLIPNQIKINSSSFSDTLIHWYSGAKRDLPWRHTRDPYIIWVSEIILQQTRVDQGLPYFHRFVEQFPDVFTLASASEDSVLAVWEGLGYYSRARNMHFTAKHVVKDLDGQFPNTYEGILKLKGIGPYTSAAISSICFGIPRPVVDGNVFRFISRYYFIVEDVSKPSTRKIFEELLSQFILPDQPGIFNQALMEYGARVCTPSPNCGECVLRAGCEARKQKRINDFPVKKSKTKVLDRGINYLVISHKDKILMKQRIGRDIWQGLYDFPEDTKTEKWVFSDPITHLLSHRRLEVRFAIVKVVKSEFDRLATTYGAKPYSLKQILTLPKPKVISNFIAKSL